MHPVIDAVSNFESDRGRYTTRIRSYVSSWRSDAYAAMREALEQADGDEDKREAALKADRISEAAAIELLRVNQQEFKALEKWNLFDSPGEPGVLSEWLVGSLVSTAVDTEGGWWRGLSSIEPSSDLPAHRSALMHYGGQ